MEERGCLHKLMNLTVTSKIYIAFLLLELLGISTLVEIYKKLIRKDKTGVWENRIVSFILSTGAVFFLDYIHIFLPMLGQLGAPAWVDHVAYIVVFYILQLFIDMKIVKKIIKAMAYRYLKRAGFSDEQICKILQGTKLDPFN